MTPVMEWVCYMLVKTVIFLRKYSIQHRGRQILAYRATPVGWEMVHDDLEATHQSRLRVSRVLI